MDSRTKNERSKNNVYEEGANGVTGQRVFLACQLHKVPEAYGPTSSKSWYPHYFNTEET